MARRNVILKGWQAVEKLGKRRASKIMSLEKKASSLVDIVNRQTTKEHGNLVDRTRRSEYKKKKFKIIETYDKEYSGFSCSDDLPTHIEEIRVEYNGELKLRCKRESQLAIDVLTEIDYYPGDWEDEFKNL